MYLGLSHLGLMPHRRASVSSGPPVDPYSAQGLNAWGFYDATEAGILDGSGVLQDFSGNNRHLPLHDALNPAAHDPVGGFLTGDGLTLFTTNTHLLTDTPLTIIVTGETRAGDTASSLTNIVSFSSTTDNDAYFEAALRDLAGDDQYSGFFAAREDATFDPVDTGNKIGQNDEPFIAVSVTASDTERYAQLNGGAKVQEATPITPDPVAIDTFSIGGIIRATSGVRIEPFKVKHIAIFDYALSQTQIEGFLRHIGVATMPVNTVAPIISGGPYVGDVLTATTGTWTGTPALFLYSYQWRRDGVDIAGATASTYTIDNADDGADITCLVTATNAGGPVSLVTNAISALAWTPQALNNPLVWWDAVDSPITQSGGAVSLWEDLFTTNPQDASQATGAKQPSTGTLSYSSRNYLEFDGVSDYLDTGFEVEDYTTVPLSIYAVVAPDTHTGTQYILDNSDGAKSIALRMVDGDVVFFAYKSSDQSAVVCSGASNVEAGVPRIIRADILPNNKLELFENGVLLSSLAFDSTVQDSFVNLRIGAEVTDKEYFGGGMTMIVMGQSMSANEHTRLYDYITQETQVINTAPDLSGQFVSPYMAWDNTLAKPVFTVEPTPENFVDPFINDKWTNWHRMTISIDTPNGYVLGTLPVPAAQLVGGSWSLSGTDASLFAINASTGQITLADAASVTTTGDRSITVTTPAGGTYDITVPVVDAASMGGVGANTFRFYDSTGTATDYNTEGGNPHDPLNVLGQLSSTKRPEDSYLKRGSVFVDGRLDWFTSSPVPCNLYDYGDPSAPRPKVIVPASYTRIGAIDDSEFTTPNPNGNTIEGVEVDCNGVAQRGAAVTNWANITLRRVRMTNNVSHANSNGFGFNDTDNVICRWCEAENHFGDGFYITRCNRVEIGFGTWNQPQGSGADSGQTTNEGSVSEFNYDIWVHDNIGRVDPALNTGKGAYANEGNFRMLFERNWAQSDVFAGGIGDFFVSSRHGYFQGHHAMLDSEFTSGHGPSQSSGPTRQYGCITTTAGRGFSWSGHNAASENWQGHEYNRGDLIMFGNLGQDHKYLIHASEPWTGVWSHNYGIDIQWAMIADNAGVATLDGDIDSIAVNGQEMTLTLPQKTHLYPTATITIAGAVNPENNISGAKVSMNSYNSIKITHPGPGAPVAESGGSITYTGDLNYTGKTIANNVDAAPTLADAPVLPSFPELTGTCQEGQTITCTVSLPPGHTADYLWHIDGLHQTGMSGAAPTVPTGSAGIDTHKPNLSALGLTVNESDLGCIVEVTNTTTGYKNIYNAIWQDTKRPMKVIAAAPVTEPYSLAGWKLTLPEDSGGNLSGNAHEILQPALLTYSHASWFKRPGNGTFEFICPDGGATTATATYARCELRHLTDYAWNAETEMKVDVSVDELGDGEKTVIFQTHDSSAPEFKMVYTGPGPVNSDGLLRILYKATEGAGDTTVVLRNDIVEGERLKIRVRRYVDELQVFLDANVDGTTPDWSSNNDVAFSRDGTNGTYYWKQGNYYQVENTPYDGTPTSTVIHYEDTWDDPILIV